MYINYTIHFGKKLIYLFPVYFARIPQILLNFRNKSTGQLSFITVFVSFAGCIARALTILVEVDDKILMVEYFFDFFKLNIFLDFDVECNLFKWKLSISVFNILEFEN